MSNLENFKVEELEQRLEMTSWCYNPCYNPCQPEPECEPEPECPSEPTSPAPEPTPDPVDPSKGKDW